MMKFTGIKETCLYVADLGASHHFYTGKLGLEVISEVPGRHIFFRAGASVLLCFIASQSLQTKELPPHGASGIIHFALEVARADYEPTLLAVRQAGIPIVHEHTWTSGRRSFYFNDPDGHLAEVVEAGMWDR